MILLVTIRKLKHQSLNVAVKILEQIIIIIIITLFIHQIPK